MRNANVQKLMNEFGFDELTAWRHERDRKIVERRYAYQNRRRGWQSESQR